jgi:hypothetical protein
LIQELIHDDRDVKPVHVAILIQIKLRASMAINKQAQGRVWTHVVNIQHTVVVIIVITIIDESVSIEIGLTVIWDAVRVAIWTFRAERWHLAFIRNAVAVTVRPRPDGRNLALVGDAVRVAVGTGTDWRHFTFIGDAIGVAVGACAVGDIAYVTDTIRLAILLTRIGEVTVVTGVAHAVCVAVSLIAHAGDTSLPWTIRHAWAIIAIIVYCILVCVGPSNPTGVTTIAYSVTVAVRLTRVGYEWAVVTHIRPSITIVVGVTHITQAILVEIGLVRVEISGTIVAPHRHAILIHIVVVVETRANVT